MDCHPRRRGLCALQCSAVQCHPAECTFPLQHGDGHSPLCWPTAAQHTQSSPACEQRSPPKYIHWGCTNTDTQTHRHRHRHDYDTSTNTNTNTTCTTCRHRLLIAVSCTVLYVPMAPAYVRTCGVTAQRTLDGGIKTASQQTCRGYPRPEGLSIEPAKSAAVRRYDRVGR